MTQHQHSQRTEKRLPTSCVTLRPLAQRLTRTPTPPRPGRRASTLGAVTKRAWRPARRAATSRVRPLRMTAASSASCCRLRARCGGCGLELGHAVLVSLAAGPILATYGVLEPGCLVLLHAEWAAGCLYASMHAEWAAGCLHAQQAHLNLNAWQQPCCTSAAGRHRDCLPAVLVPSKRHACCARPADQA